MVWGEVGGGCGVREERWGEVYGVGGGRTEVWS